MSNDMLQAGLAYARMNWRVFPLHTIVNGQCTCHKKCTSPGKHPRTAKGFKDATNDQDQIRKWWARWPDANIGIATGSGLVVIDIDGAEGMAAFKALVAAHGPPPATLVCQTGLGFHAFYLTRPDSPQVRSSAVGKVHVRGEGGYVVAAPSRHASGRIYTWIKKLPVATLPDWLRQWSQGYEISGNRVAVRDHGLVGSLGVLPNYLASKTTQAQRDPGRALSETLRSQYSASEQARLISALAAIPVKTCSYDDFLRIGMALKELDWTKSDGTDIGFEIWDAWCAQSEHHNQAGLEAKWRSFRRSGVSIGTVYHLAQRHGWNGIPNLSGGASALAQSDSTTPPLYGRLTDTGQLNGHANGVNGNHALPAAFLQPTEGAIFFPDLDEKRRPRPTCTNAGVAIQGMAITCEKDQFHEKMTAGGHMIEQWAGDLSDEVIQMLRKTIRAKFGFDPGEKNVRDACIQLCLENQFDPILDYLNGLKWDGTPRLDRWLTTYMGAPDTELNRVIGRLVLIAAVRRQYKPGTKFDQIVVLESKEGYGKSTTIEILAGKENFSDQSILNKQEREQQEAMCGVWLYEIADLTGMKKTEVEHIKAFASRNVDRARPAYGRFRIDRPRRTVFFATTNDDEYLKSQTGNRRFWPVVVGRIELEALKRDRDQIWAEAVACEARGDSISLPQRLWAVAGEEQDTRRESDDWFELIARYIESKAVVDISITEVLCDNQWIMRKPDMVSRADTMRAGAILKRLKFTRYHKRIADGFAWRYKRA